MANRVTLIWVMVFAIMLSLSKEVEAASDDDHRSLMCLASATFVDRPTLPYLLLTAHLTRDERAYWAGYYSAYFKLTGASASKFYDRNCGDKT